MQLSDGATKRSSETYTLAKALDIFRARKDQARPLVVDDLYDELDWSRRTIHNKLGELEDDGVLRSRTVGARAKVWWAPLPREDVSLVSMGLLGVNTPSTVDEVLTHAGEAIPGRSDDKQRERAAAVLTAYRFLQKQGQASGEEIRERTYSEHPLESDTKSQSAARIQWTRYLRKGLAELPGIEASARGQQCFVYIDPDGPLAEALDVQIDDEVRNNAEPTGQGEGEARQLAIAQLAYDHLKEKGETAKPDLKEILPNYTSHYANFEGLWTYFLKDALKNMPGVEYEQAQQASVFKYVREPDDSEET
jgi:hypothetical protein